MTSTAQPPAQAPSMLVHNLMNQLNCTAAEAEKLIARSQSNPVLGRLMQEKQRILKSNNIDDDKLVPDYYESKQQQAPTTRADLEQVTQHVSNRRDDNPHHQRNDENDDDEYDYMEVEEEIQVEYINGEMYEVVEEIEEEETYFEEEEVTLIDEEVTLMDEEETIVEVVEETFHEDDNQSEPHSSLWIEKDTAVDQSKKLPTTLQQSTRVMKGNGEVPLNGGNKAVVVDTVATMDGCTTVPKTATTATLGYHSPPLTSTLSLENERKRESLPHTIMDEAKVTIGDTINTTQKDNLSELNDNKSVAQVEAKSLANDKESPSLEASSTKVLSTRTDKENDTQRIIRKERQTLENVEKSDTAASSTEKDSQSVLPIEQIQESMFISNNDTKDKREGGQSLVEQEPVLFDVDSGTTTVYTAESTSDHDESICNIQGNRNRENIKGNLADQKPISEGKEILFVQKALSTETKQENDLTDANASYEKDPATNSALKQELVQPRSAQSVETVPSTVLDEGKGQHQKQPEADLLRQKLEDEIKALEAAITNQQGTPAKTAKKCPVLRKKKIVKKRVVREKQMNTKSDGAHSAASIVNVGNACNSDKAQRSTLPIAPGKKKTGVGSKNPSSVDTVMNMTTKTQARPKPVVQHESVNPYDGVVLKKSSTLCTESCSTDKEKKEPNSYNPYGSVVLKKILPPTGVHNEKQPMSQQSTKDNTDSETTAKERITGNTLVDNYSTEEKPITCIVSTDFVSGKDAPLRVNTPSPQASAETIVAHAETENIEPTTAIDPAKESNIVPEEPSSPTIKPTVPFEKDASIETRKMTQVTGQSVEGKRTSPANTAATEVTTESANANIDFDGETSAENIEKKSTTSVVIPVDRTMNARNDDPKLSPATSVRAEESNVSMDQKCTENSETRVSTTVKQSLGRPQSPVQTMVAKSATRQIQTTMETSPTLKTKDSSQSTSSSQDNQRGGTTDSIQIRGPRQVDANEKPNSMVTKALPTSPQSTLTAESSAANGGPAVAARGKKVTRKTSRRKRRQNATKKKRDPPAFTPSTYKANSFRQADEQGMDRIRIFGRWYHRAEPGTWFDEITSEPVYTTPTTTTVESSK